MNNLSSDAQVADARTLAAKLFRACLDRQVTVEDIIDKDSRAGTLSFRDRALLASILLTGFRHLGEIEAVLKKLLDKPLPRKSGPAADILALGVAQLLFLDMPAHAVIDLSVRAAKADRNALHFSGLVNAVLRKVAAGGQGLLEGVEAASLNTPPWLWEKWSKAHGGEAARLIGLVHARRPALDLSFKDDAAPWIDALGGTLLPNGQVRLQPGHPSVPELAGFAEGAWWVQDAASTIPVNLLGDVRGLRVLDLCAAPGGKTMQLAAHGADVTAVDISAARISRLRANLERTGLKADLRIEDVLGEALTGEWDAVLLDAPCTATGTIRRHPELPYLKKPRDLRELGGLQKRLLRKAASLVKPDGRLVYCTCSLEPEEGEAHIKKFLAEAIDYELVPSSLPWLPRAAVRPEGWVRTLPFMEFGAAAGLDGFFTAVLRRVP